MEHLFTNICHKLLLTLRERNTVNFTGKPLILMSEFSDTFCPNPHSFFTQFPMIFTHFGMIPTESLFTYRHPPLSGTRNFPAAQGRVVLPSTSIGRCKYIHIVLLCIVHYIGMSSKCYVIDIEAKICWLRCQL